MIYFAHADELNRVKIGFAADPWKRLSKMQSDSPCALALVAICPGDVADEQALHTRFASDRLRGEWFGYSASIRAHVATLPTPIRPQPERTVQTVSELVGISQSYASMILSGARTPPKNLAIFMFRRTLWKHPSIADLTEADIAVFEKHDPWTPPKERQDEAA